MTQMKHDQAVINLHVKRTNQQISKSKKITKTLFETIRSGYDELKDCKESLQYFKFQINADRSTINKIISIAADDFVMTNLDALPMSWATLYAISNLMKKHPDVIESAFNSGKITQKTTLKELNELINNTDRAKKSEDPIIKFDSSNYCEDQIDRLNKLLEALKEEFGFHVQDTAKKSETPVSEKVAA